MLRRSLLFVLTLMVLVAVTTAGCKKAPPEPPADIETETRTTPPPERTTPPPEPTTTNDRTPTPLDGELMQARDYAYSEGLLGEIYFAYDSSALTSAAREQLSKNAQFFSGAGRSFTVTIEGHCDDRGTTDYNIALGERRANAARDYLISLGVEGSRLRTISFGEERPKCTTAAESCWSRNRRGFFDLTGRQ